VRRVGGGTRRTQLSAPRAFEKSFKKSARTFFSFFIFLFFPLISMCFLSLSQSRYFS